MAATRRFHLQCYRCKYFSRDGKVENCLAPSVKTKKPLARRLGDYTNRRCNQFEDLTT